MPLETLEPNSCSKTMQGYGTGTCGTCSAGGESCNCEAASGCDSGSNELVGVTFYNFDAPTQQDNYTSVVLKVSWKLHKRNDGDADSCNIERMYLMYSLNGGGSFSYFDGFHKTQSGSNQTGTASKTLSVSQDMSDVKVRAYARADCCTPCTGADECCQWVPELGRDICWCVSGCGNCPADCSPGAC